MSFSENHKLQFAMENAFNRLPQEYTISIYIEQGTVQVVVYDIDGEEFDFSPNAESLINGESLAEAINSAVEFAEAKQ